MTTAEIKRTTETKMDQTIAAFTHNLTKIRTGRANPALPATPRNHRAWTRSHPLCAAGPTAETDTTSGYEAG